MRLLMQLLKTPLLCGGWQVVSELQARADTSHRQEITNVLWALAALDQLRPQHFASLTAMLDVESVLENMSHSGARQLSQVAAFSHAVQPVCVAFNGPAIIAHLSCFPHNPVTSWAASKSHYGFLQYSCTLSDD